MKGIIPIIPVAIDLWTMRKVAATATTISTSAPRRSDQRTRLKNIHQTRINNPPATLPRTPTPAMLGATTGTTNQASHCNTTATTPGQSNSGLRIEILFVDVQEVCLKLWALQGKN